MGEPAVLLIRQHLEKGHVQLWDRLVTRRAATTGATDTRLLQGLRVREFLHALGNGMPVTVEDARDITEAAAPRVSELRSRHTGAGLFIERLW